jgi:hypothetical protein
MHACSGWLESTALSLQGTRTTMLALSRPAVPVVKDHLAASHLLAFLPFPCPSLSPDRVAAAEAAAGGGGGAATASSSAAGGRGEGGSGLRKPKSRSERIQQLRQRGDDSGKGEGEEDGGGYQDAQDALEEMIEEVGAVQGAVQWVDACWRGAVAAEK